MPFLKNENEVLNEENGMLKKDLEDLNKYDIKKYEEMRKRHNKVVLIGNKSNFDSGLSVLRELFPLK